MFSSFSEFFVCVREAKFTFGVIWDYIVSFYYALTENPSISAVWNGIMDVFHPVSIIFMLVVVAVCLAVAFFGRKIMPILKFLSFFVLGFVFGTHLLAPLLPPEVSIPDWIIGIVLALIAAVLSRFLYVILYVTAVGYSAYVLIYYGFYLQLDAMYSGSRVAAGIIAAVIAIVLALLFRKYIEMAGTAALGAFCAVWVFRNYVYDFTTWQLFGGNVLVAVLVTTILVGLLGLFVQFKTRRRY